MFRQKFTILDRRYGKKNGDAIVGGVGVGMDVLFVFLLFREMRVR